MNKLDLAVMVDIVDNMAMVESKLKFLCWDKWIVCPSLDPIGLLWHILALTGLYWQDKDKG